MVDIFNICNICWKCLDFIWLKSIRPLKIAICQYFQLVSSTSLLNWKICILYLDNQDLIQQRNQRIQSPFPFQGNGVWKHCQNMQGLVVQSNHVYIVWAFTILLNMSGFSTQYIYIVVLLLCWHAVSTLEQQVVENLKSMKFVLWQKLGKYGNSVPRNIKKTFVLCH